MCSLCTKGTPSVLVLVIGNAALFSLGVVMSSGYPPLCRKIPENSDFTREYSREFPRLFPGNSPVFHDFLGIFPGILGDLHYLSALNSQYRISL
jgi:hypothetical protein